jgi:hypothetical protein
MRLLRYEKLSILSSFLLLLISHSDNLRFVSEGLFLVFCLHFFTGRAGLLHALQITDQLVKFMKSNWVGRYLYLRLVYVFVNRRVLVFGDLIEIRGQLLLSRFFCFQILTFHSQQLLNYQLFELSRTLCLQLLF